MKKAILLIAIIFIGFGVANAVRAEEFKASAPDDFKASAPPETSSKLPTLSNPLKVNSLTELLLEMVDLLIFVGVMIAFFMFIFIGFKFVWAQGKPAEIAEARKWFLWAVVGTAILISSKVLVVGIKNTLISAGVVDQSIWNNPR